MEGEGRETARWVSLIGLASLLLVANAARGDEGESPWHLQIEALTEVPIDVGARVLIEVPARLRLSSSLGVLPSPYVDVINDSAVALGGYNQQTADLIASSLGSSLVWRTHLGWRPFPRAGFAFDVGYGLVTLGGGVNAADALAAAAGHNAPAKPGGATYNVASTLQMIDADLGWEWKLLGDHLVIEAALGFSGTLAASTSATPQGSQSRVKDAFGEEAANYLDGLYTSYVFTPVVTAAVGYRFF
jgi:hypothetical protein